ncbi:MAG: DUF883 domain-containing protein [Curvibacter sp.]|nr:DUF883 domain-containing protein [Curvibacter sp.]
MSATQNEGSRPVSQSELENLVADLRQLITRQELDSVPEIKALRERMDAGLQSVRATAVEAAQEAARQAREAVRVANNYAHDEPWRVAGTALAVGALLGFLLGRR